MSNVLTEPRVPLETGDTSISKCDTFEDYIIRYCNYVTKYCALYDIKILNSVLYEEILFCVKQYHIIQYYIHVPIYWL